MSRPQAVRLSVVALLVASAASVEAADRSGRPTVARRFFNPFSVTTSTRLTANPFGLPAIAETPVFAESVAASSAAAQPKAVEAVAPTVTAEESAASAATSVVDESLDSIEFTPMAMTSRPPFRPRVRSAFRPPPRPPFGP